MEHKIHLSDFQNELDFLELIQDILISNGFEVVEMQSRYQSHDFELIIENTTAYVDVKLYRTKFPKLDLLERACVSLASLGYTQKAKLILIVSSYVTPSLKLELFNETGVIVWDAKTLFALSYDFSTLYYKLENILANTFNTAVDDLTIIEKNYKQAIISFFKTSAIIERQKQIIDKGKKLCAELQLLQPGRVDAIKYEDKCIEILKYLFDNKTDLTLWKTQPTTDDGLHRFDLLCRIISTHQNSFWSELSNDFHTRYILFEFKNYTDKIKKGQIYTTEKYLFLTALRSVSFIIARNGADDNAVLAAKGALKEAGKLIIILTMNDICDMLTLKDKGDEPATILRDKIDEMLITFSR